MKDFWNERYNTTEYAYGTKPNEFFKEQIDKLTPGKILLVGEGEGRNAVYAAAQGWEVTAIDFSEVAKNKALELARYLGTSINYILIEAENYLYPENYFDVVGLIYAHFSPETRSYIHQKCNKTLISKGTIIIEAFNPNQENNLSGGPKDYKMLYDQERLEFDFVDLKILEVTNKTINLDEGQFHQGKADIIRLVALKW